jgi:biopolymer transport protein TolR
MSRFQADINTTPLIDVQRPTDPAPARSDPHHVVLEYLASGEMRLNQQPVDAGGLGLRLRDVYASCSDRTLYLMGDGRLRYGLIVDVIDIARGAGVDRVGVVTEGARQAARGVRD